MSPFKDLKIGETRSCNHPIDPSSPYEKGNICDKCLNKDALKLARREIKEWKKFADKCERKLKKL